MTPLLVSLTILLAVIRHQLVCRRVTEMLRKDNELLTFAAVFGSARRVNYTRSKATGNLFA